jgi:uncharacterized membrane-anchored protein
MSFPLANSFPSAHALVARIPLLWRTLAAILVLIGALGLVIEGRAGILRSGTEVRLRTVPVDPRDLFRGDYVVLSYAINTVEAAEAGTTFERGDKVYVTLSPGPDGFAQARQASHTRPATTVPDVVIAGRVTSTSACALNDEGLTDCRAGRRRLRVVYGLESYFVPQGTGRAIETTDKKRLEIVAAVSSAGEAAIKRMLIDGKLVHAEPPY